MADRTVSYTFTGNFANLTAGLTAAGRNVAELGTKMTALDKNGAKMRAGLTTIGQTAGKIGLVAAAGVAVAIGAAARFDKAMSAVQAATHETASNMDDLREAAIKAGADTVYSASEAAGAIEELAKAGVSTKDILAGGLSGSLNLAAAGAIEVADAAELAATAMTQFKLGGDQVNHVADLLAAGAGKAQGSVGDLGMALKQSGLVAAQTGLSIEETVGTLSAFASAGLIGSDAGTSFKTMLQSLTPTGEKAGATMDALGISAYDAQGNFIGMTAFAGQLREALSGLSTEQQNAALKTIFGSDAVRAAAVIYQQGAGGIQDWIDKTNDAGYAADTAGKRMDNLAGDLEQFKGSLETALIGAGEGSQGPLRSLVQGLTKTVNAFNSLPGPAKNAAMALGGITAVLGGGVWFTAKVVNGVTEMKSALSNLGIAGERTSKALTMVGKGATIAAGALVGLAIIDQVQSSAKKAGIGVEQMTASLLSLQDVASLPEDLDDLSHSIERLADPNIAQHLQDNIAGVIGFGGGSELANAKTQIEAIDAALSNLVLTAGTDRATATFDQLTESAGLSESQIDDLRNLLPQYGEALTGAANDAKLAGDAQTDLAGSTSHAAIAANKAKERQEALRAELSKQRDAARDTAKGFVGLGDSLDDSKKSLAEWLKDLEQQASALRDFTKNAKTAAKNGLDEGLIKSLNEAGPAGAMRMKQLANATDAEIRRANKAWRDGQAAIREYVNMRVPDKEIRVDDKQALAAIRRIKAEMAGIRDKSVRLTYYVNQVNASNVRGGGGRDGDPSTPQADGGFVPKTGLPYGDRWPYLLADGEGVTTNRHGETDRFRDVIGGINAGLSRAQIKGMLADGGFAGRTATIGAGGTPGFEIITASRRTAAALSRLGDTSEREGHRREKLLDRQERLAEKALEQAQERLDEERAQLKALRDARKQFEASVTANFRSDVFGGTDLEQAARQGLLGGDFMQGLLTWLRESGVEMQAGTMASDYAGQYLATLSPQQIAALQAQASLGTLQQNSQDAQAFEQVLQQLRDMGLAGGAFAELAASGNLGQAQAYLAMGPDFVKTLMQEFRDRNADLKNLGAYVGNAQFGADIREQLKEARQANRLAQEARDELRSITRAQRDVAQRLDRIEKNSPKRTGDAVARAIDGGSAAASRRT